MRMKKQINGQVPLSSLIFTANWEDPESDIKAVDMKPGQSLLTITSGGCNILHFLLYDPEVIYAVDINPAQTWLMELKIAAIKNLSYDDFVSFMGLQESACRETMFSSLSKDLSPDALHFWKMNLKLVKKGVLLNGKFERFIKIAGKLLGLMQGRRKVDKVFTSTNKEEQNKFFKEEWDNRRWRLLFKLMMNKKRLAKKGLVAEYFHFDDGAQSFSESFYNRARKALCDIPIKSNYFLSVYFSGKYRNEISLPAYLMPDNFGHIKRNIDRIKLITADTKYWLEAMPAQSIDGFCLSNICELMSEADTFKLFTEVVRTAKPHAKICFRNLMIPREVPESMKDTVVKNETLSAGLLANDRSFVYSKVAAYDLVN